MITGGLLVLAGFARGGLFGTLMKLGGVYLIYRGQENYAPLHRALGRELPQEGTAPKHVGHRVEAEVTVDRDRSELYRVWRNLENLPAFMSHLAEVEEIDDERSRWTAKGPAGSVVRWEARILNDIEDELIAWESLEGSGVNHAGSVHFEPGFGGLTRVRVVLRYTLPAGAFGEKVASLLHVDPQRQIEEDLYRFKQIMEAVPRSVAVGSFGEGA